MVVKANIIRTYDSIYDYRDTVILKTFDIKLSITNKSVKPVSFWMMTCSWEDNFIINNDYLNFIGKGCDRNFPTTRHLNPNDSLIFIANVRKSNSSRYQSVEASKFGFVFIDSIRCAKIDDYNNIIGDKSNQDKIIWSNPLYLNDKK